MATKVLLVDDNADDAQFFSDALNELAQDIVLDYCSSGELGGVNPSDVGAAAYYQKSNSFGDLKSSLASLLGSILP